MRIIAKKLSSEQIQQIHTLYQQIGTYSGVAKQMGIAATTVSKYIKMHQSTKNTLTSLSYNLAPKPIEKIDFNSLLTFSTLTLEEQQSYDEWLGEFNL